MPSLDTIHGLIAPVLNDMIAEHCAGWTLLTTQEHAASGCTHRAPDGGLYTVPDYTGDWNVLMPLVIKYGINQHWYCNEAHWEFFHPLTDGAFCVLLLCDEALYQRRLAELALYVAMQKQTRPPHQDGTACTCVPSTAGYWQRHGAPDIPLPDAFYAALQTLEAPEPDCAICHHTTPVSALCSRCGPACVPCQRTKKEG